MFIQIQTILYFLLGIINKSNQFWSLIDKKNNALLKDISFSLSDHSNLSRLVQLIKKN